MGCEELQLLAGYEAKCSYLCSYGDCVGDGYINYLYLFYCVFGEYPVIGYMLLALWILVLFYVLGDTASNYFCSCLERLSGLLKLSPTIAGVTLLSLGNGAPDVFSSLVSFTGGGTFDVGFNTVLGGASVVTCVVAGVVSILVRGRKIEVNKAAFARNIGFYFFVITMLFIIFLIGKVNLWGAILFWLTYIIYVLIVYSWNSEDVADETSDDSDGELREDLANFDEELMVPFLHKREEFECEKVRKFTSFWEVVPFVFEMLLSLPRRLTIPIICEARWSKFYFVVSNCLAPIFLATLWYVQDNTHKFTMVMMVYGMGVILSGGLGLLGYFTSNCSIPPNKFIFLWLILGFLMSMIWSYIIAEELLGLLLSVGYIVGVSPSILGFTVLAWGNSIGDLITDSTMALKDGSRGAQIAMSGCFAGPMFNIVFGLGLSMICASWDTYPSSITIAWDPYLVETLGFLSCSLLWSVMNLSCRNGKLDAVFGAGFIVIYCSLFLLRVFSQ